jgi:hypothetical protein
MPPNEAIFAKKLREAIGWTSHLAKDFDYEEGNYGTVFRQTNPEVNGVKAFNIDLGYTTWNIDDYDVNNYQTLLNHPLQTRRSQPGIQGELSISGRVLCFETCLTTHDGAAIVESNCFLDEGDIPPIDTWFYLDEITSGQQRPTLYCWIPEKFLPIIMQGIAVEIMDSYRWLDEIDPSFYNSVLAKLKVL